jgi:hypothetical protein
VAVGMSLLIPWQNSLGPPWACMYSAGMHDMGMMAWSCAAWMCSAWRALHGLARRWKCLKWKLKWINDDVSTAVKKLNLMTISEKKQFFLLYVAESFHADGPD